jgi:hypothetical protein
MPLGKVKATTAEVTAACDAIDSVIGRFLSAREEIRGYEKYESSVEALNLFYLCVRHIEGVITAAREDLVLIPAAHACARAALETATKGAWMVDHNDPFVRESRWLAHMAEEERVYERSAKRYAEMGYDASNLLERAASIKEFRVAVESKMPAYVELLKHNPTVDDMLGQLGGKVLYPLYIFLSQAVHGGHLATGIYRKGLGNLKEPGEYISPSHWFVPLRVSWLALSQLGALTLRRLGRDSRLLLEAQLSEQISRRITRVSDTSDI